VRTAITITIRATSNHHYPLQYICHATCPQRATQKLKTKASPQSQRWWCAMLVQVAHPAVCVCGMMYLKCALCVRLCLANAVAVD
jgi:hypothetical protein